MASQHGFVVEERNGSFFVIEREDAGKFHQSRMMDVRSFKVQYVSATDVQAAVESQVASGLIYDGPSQNPTRPLDQIRIAFDGDAVLFSEESEMIYQQQGLEAFIAHEKHNAEQPLNLKTRSP